LVARFPLTLALSLGEREHRSPIRVRSRGSYLKAALGASTFIERSGEGEFVGVRGNVHERDVEVAIAFVGVIWGDGLKFFAVCGRKVLDKRR
jgi:hypothetical protein